MLQAYLVVLAGLVAMQLTPGPNLVVIASVGMGQGRRAALFVTAGIATGAAVWVLLVAAGLGTVLRLYPAFITALKLGGGAYLAWLGVKALLASRRSVAPPTGSVRIGDGAAWRRGVLVVLTNPKVALGWVAIAAFLFGSGLSAWQVAAFAPVAAGSACLVYGGYALLFSTGVAASAYRRCSQVAEAVFGAMFGVMGATLVAAGIRDLRP